MHFERFSLKILIDLQSLISLIEIFLFHAIHAFNVLILKSALFSVAGRLAPHSPFAKFQQMDNQSPATTLQTAPRYKFSKSY